MSNEYSQVPISVEDLKEFASTAYKYVREKFNDKEPTLIVLSQGSALHYALGNGLIPPQYTRVKDIDIWVFYDGKQYPEIKNYCRITYKFDYMGSNMKFGNNPNEPKYKGRRMDILLRAINFTNPTNFDAIKTDVVKYFSEGKRSIQLEKAGFAIYPDNLCGKNLWLPKAI